MGDAASECADAFQALCAEKLCFELFLCVMSVVDGKDDLGCFASSRTSVQQLSTMIFLPSFVT
jgi:hypothetical protein